LAHLIISFIDLFIGFSAFKVLEERSISKKSFHYIFNFRNNESEYQNNKQQKEEQMSFYTLAISISTLLMEKD